MKNPSPRIRILVSSSFKKLYWGLTITNLCASDLTDRTECILSIQSLKIHVPNRFTCHWKNFVVVQPNWIFVVIAYLKMKNTLCFSCLKLVILLKDKYNCNSQLPYFTVLEYLVRSAELFWGELRLHEELEKVKFNYSMKRVKVVNILLCILVLWPIYFAFQITALILFLLPADKKLFLRLQM